MRGVLLGQSGYAIRRLAGTAGPEAQARGRAVGRSHASGGAHVEIQVVLPQGGVANGIEVLRDLVQRRVAGVVNQSRLVVQPELDILGVAINRDAGCHVGDQVPAPIVLRLEDVVVERLLQGQRRGERPAGPHRATERAQQLQLMRQGGGVRGVRRRRRCWGSQQTDSKRRMPGRRPPVAQSDRGCTPRPPAMPRTG